VRLPSLLRGGRTISVAIVGTLPGPPSVVWELITDWENLGDWMLEAREFEVLSQRHEGVGVLAEATVTIGGITTRDKVWVSAWEPERLLEIEHLGWVSGRGEFSITPAGSDRSHVRWVEELRPPLGALGAVGMSVFKPLMQRIFERDLRVLAGLVRARARPG
jgi:Polyketide cyclase / dehydrase and lipid transport